MMVDASNPRYIHELTRQNLQQLKHRLSGGALTPSYAPVVFLGAGFSIWMCGDVAVPEGWKSTWRELLTCLASHLPDGYNRKVDQLLKANLASDVVFGFMEAQYPDAYHHALCEAFWQEPAVCEMTLRTIQTRNEARWRTAHRIFQRSRGVVTTNFDPLAWELVSTLQDEKLPWQLFVCDTIGGVPGEALEALKSATPNFKPLIMLHGGLQEPSTLDWPQSPLSAKRRLGGVVLSDMAYAQAYFYGRAKRGYKSRAEFLHVLYRQCPLLFLGFSLSDVLINQCLNQARAGLGIDRQEHFVILHGPTESLGGTAGTTVLQGAAPPDCVGELYQNVYKLGPIFLDAMPIPVTGLSISEAMDSLWEELETRLQDDSSAAKAARQRLLEQALREKVQ